MRNRFCYIVLMKWGMWGLGRGVGTGGRLHIKQQVAMNVVKDREKF